MPMDDDWKPRWNPAVRVEQLPLAAEEGFVLSRLDGHTRVADLPSLTRLTPEQVNRVMRRLEDLGAVLPAPAAAGDPRHEEEPEGAPETSEAAEESPDHAGTHRRLYEAELHGLEADARVAMARTAGEPRLTALCYDPLPAVIRSLLLNPLAGLTHARLVAQQHRHPMGLEAISTRAAFANDAGVRRWLLRNPQLPAALFNRLFGTRPMRDLYLSAVSREIPDTTRRLSREALRRRFATAAAEERVALIIQSEGRVLPLLIALPVDGRTAAQLCGRTYASTLLVQNLARWSAAPPPLIAHLLRQELVRRSPSLRTLLQRHPNAPRG